MIILEGPDGAGKTNMSKRLHDRLGLPLHERAATSEGGPVADLWDWTVRDVASWDTAELSVYDRHPLVSEYIYGPVIRGKLSDGFDHPSAMRMRRQMAQRCLMILCLPPLAEVVKNVQNEAVVQMAGVQDKTIILYNLYASFRSSWTGWLVSYDYTEREDSARGVDAVIRAAMLHTALFKRTITHA